MLFLKVLFIQITTAAAFCALHLGLDWISEGYGLNPLVAGAFIAVLIGVPHFALQLLRRIA